MTTIHIESDSRVAKQVYAKVLEAFARKGVQVRFLSRLIKCWITAIDVIQRTIQNWWAPIKEVEPEPPKAPRRKVDTATIRTRITSQGWKLREIPIKRNHPDPTQRKVIQWKMIAIKGDKSIELGGPTIDEAMKNIGITLGVIPRES